MADFPPTDQHREVQQVLEERLQNNYQQELQGLVQHELPAFNRTLEERKLLRLVTGRKRVTTARRTSIVAFTPATRSSRPYR